MKKNIKNSVMYYTFDTFSTIPHCFSTKIGGVSTGGAATMNLAPIRDTNKKNVEKNYEILCNTIGFDYESIVAVKQKHTANVLEVSKKDVADEPADAMITNNKNLTLTTLHADCLAVYFYDPIKKAIGLAHAGWRGTVGGIVANTLNKMIDTYSTNPSDIIAGISPGVGSCCFCVDGEVAGIFTSNTLTHSFITQKMDKLYIDLAGINKKILTSMGVKNIEVANICTKCNSNIFYSHRVTGFDRGCMAAMIRL